MCNLQHLGELTIVRTPISLPVNITARGSFTTEYKYPLGVITEIVNWQSASAGAIVAMLRHTNTSYKRCGGMVTPLDNLVHEKYLYSVTSESLLQAKKTTMKNANARIRRAMKQNEKKIVAFIKDFGSIRYQNCGMSWMHGIERLEKKGVIRFSPKKYGYVLN